MSTKWDAFHMSHAAFISQLSKDPDHKVGAIIVDHERRLVGSGYNGFPRGVHDFRERYENKLVKRSMIVHAEANAIMNSVKSVRDCTLYATRHPCTDCVKMIIQCGVARVFAPNLEPGSSWADDANFARVMMREAGVIFHAWTEHSSRDCDV